MVDLHDTIALGDASKRVITKDGFMKAPAVISRAGNVQPYTRGELKLAGDPREVVRLYRDPSEVFAKDALESFAKLPITIGHPKEPVTASNWRTLSHGESGDPTPLHDSNELLTEVTIRSAEAKRAIEKGTKYFSCGYSVDLDMTPGRTPSGEPYEGRQTKLRGQHLALVDTPRGGLSCKVSDSTHGVKRMATFLIDGFAVECEDAIAPTLKTLLAQRDEARTALDGASKASNALALEKSGLQKQIADQAAQIAVLEKKASDEVVEVRARERATLIANATKFCPKLVCDGKSDPQIRREALGILAKDGITKRVLDALAKGQPIERLEDGVLTMAFDAIVATASAPVNSARLGDGDRVVGEALSADSGGVRAAGSYVPTTTLKINEFRKVAK